MYIDFLVDSKGQVKLADFGLARIWEESDRDLSHQVCTRHYRPPELLYASRQYTPALDIWGLGVIFAELVLLRTLFPGQNDIDQMYKVFQVMGSPNPLTWPVTKHTILIFMTPCRRSYFLFLYSLYRRWSCCRISPRCSSRRWIPYLCTKSCLMLETKRFSS
ncbi:hypothetical protein EON65_23635 [archaeon]|nr:MAG: hypothetical protein EON65_23635 [archaeon]